MDEITKNNEVIEQVAEQAVEVAVSKNNVNLGKVGACVLGVGATVGGVVLIVKGVKYVVTKINEKKQQKAAAAADVDNVEIAKRDFLD